MPVSITSVASLSSWSSRSCSIIRQTTANKTTGGCKQSHVVTFGNRKNVRADTSFSFFKATLFAVVVEEAIIKIQILTDCSNENAYDKIFFDMDKYVKKKYGVTESILDEDEIGDRNIYDNEFKMYKMDRDRSFFTEVMRATFADLTLNHDFKALIDKNNELIERDNTYAVLQMEKLKLSVLHKDVRRRLRTLRIKNKSLMYDTSVQLDRLQKSIEDSELTQETQNRHADKWEKARTEQHLQIIGLRESESTKSISYYRDKIGKEHFVHSEIDALVNIAINETMSKVQSWMEKYEKDTEAIDLKIQVKRSEYQTMLERRMEHEETFARHNSEMWEWNEFKRKRAEALKYRDDMTHAAIVIQGWWRGLLVRKELGPYRKTKKRRAPKKK